MKRYNFSCYASEKQEAVSRTTTTKPVDFVGEARITRFRLSRGSIPIFYLEPSKVAYTDAQKNIIVNSGVTPTDICFLVAQFSITRDNFNPSDAPNNTCQYWVGTLKERAGVCSCNYEREFVFNDQSTVLYCSICVAYPTTPTFEKRGNRWYLTTEKYPIYDWDSLNKDTFAIKHVSEPMIQQRQMLLTKAKVKLQIKEENGFPMFHINVFETYGDNCFTDIKTKYNERFEPYLEYNAVLSYISEPVLFMNEEALKLMGMNLTEMSSVLWQPGTIGHFTDRIRYYAPPLRVRNPGPEVERQQNMYFNGTITLVSDGGGTAEVNERCLQYNYDTDFDACFITVPQDIFPVSQILITSDELDFQGESISVDTTARQGVIDPSSLHILKSFFVGITDTVEIDASDFVYTDDSLNQSPIIVNNPRTCSLTFRVWFLLKTGELKKCVLEPGKGFSLQLGIY